MTSTLAERKPQPALFRQIEEAVDVMGSKALKIAVYDLENLSSVAFLISQNLVSEGAFGQALTSCTFEDGRGRTRKVMNNGVARELAVRWSERRANLMYGIGRDEMADLSNLRDRYDSRLDGYCKAISDACEKAFGVVVGWYRGRFRVLTVKQCLEKETRLIRSNLEGGARRAEKTASIAQTRAIGHSKTLYLQAGLWENTVGEADELS